MSNFYGSILKTISPNSAQALDATKRAIEAIKKKAAEKTVQQAPQIQQMKVVTKPTQTISMPTGKGKSYEELNAEEKYQYYLADKKVREERGLKEKDTKLMWNFVGASMKELGNKEVDIGERGIAEIKSKGGSELSIRLIKSLEGIFGTPALMLGQGIEDLSGGFDLGQKPSIVKGVSGIAFGLAGATGTGAAFNALFAQPEVEKGMMAFEKAKQSTLKKIYKTEIGKKIPQEAKDALSLGVDLLALAVIHRAAKIPFKENIKVEVPTKKGIKQISVPTDRAWWAKTKESFMGDLETLVSDPLGFMKEKQIGLSIKDVSGDLPEIPKLENKLKNIYKETGPSEKYPEFSKADEVFADIFEELDLSEAGYRIMDPNTFEYSGVSSTFPKWIPEDLRSKSLFAKVMQNLEIDKIKFPEGRATRQRDLYNTILDQADLRLGTDTSLIRGQIIKQYEPKTNTRSQEGLTGKDSGSAQGSEGSRGRGESAVAARVEGDQSLPDFLLPENKRGDTPLHEEAKKYKSAEEFVGAVTDPYKMKGTPDEKTATDMIVQNAIYQGETPSTIKISDLKFNEKELMSELKPKAGRTIDTPVIVEKGVLKDGHHRVAQALANGEDSILAFEKKPLAKTKSQLTDIWNEANAKDARLADKQNQNLPDQKGRLEDYSTEEKRGIQKETSPKADKPPSLESSVSAKLDNRVSLDKNVPQIKKVASELKEKPQVVARVANGVQDFFLKGIEYFQDAEIRVKKLMEREDVKVSDISDPYLKATLFPGKVATKVQKGYTEASTMIKEMQLSAKESNVKLKDVKDDVEAYLLAKHAPERNAALGDGAAGISNTEAAKTIQRIEALPNAAKIKEIANTALDLNKKTLEMLKESGVISKELFEQLNNKYKNHVPLQRILQDSENVGSIISGKGYDVKSSGIKRAKGSDLEVDSIMANILTNYEQAVIRSEKNIVDQATLAFVRDNAKSLEGLMEVRKPKAIGTDFKGKIIKEKTDSPTVLQLFEDGKPIWIDIKDKNLAIALKGLGKEKLGPILNFIGSFTRVYSGLQTRFNPEFALPNKIRDMQETMVFMAAQKPIGAKGAFKTLAKDPRSIKSVIDAIRGKDTEGARLYKEMQENGGTTGGFGLSTKEQVKLNIGELEKLATSNVKLFSEKFVQYVDDWNTIAEDSTRLSVYRQSLEQGLSKERSAFLAKEASINFNRMGKGGPVVNALWMFSNASIQGSAKMLRSLKNPKVLATVTLAVATSVGTVNTWNNFVDPDWRDKVAKWDRLGGLPIVLPSADGKFKYVTIPVSWGIKPIKVAADYAFDSLDGQSINGKDALNDIAVAILESYNPAGGTDLISALTPTILDAPSEISRNKSWSGNKIRPDFDQNAPKDIQYFDSLGNTKTGRVAIGISEALQKNMDISISPADIKYAYDAYVGGAGRTASKFINTISSIGGDKKLPLDEYPFVSRFYRESDEDEIVSRLTGDSPTIKSLLASQSREKFYLKKEAQKLDLELQSMSSEEANKKYFEIQKSNPDLAEKLDDVIDDRKLGLTSVEKKMKQLGVENNLRANYIYSQLERIGSESEREDYKENLKTKKLLTPEVEKQLKEVEKEAEKYKAQAESAGDEKSMAEVTKLYMKAFSVDPFTALKTLFTSEQLRDVRSDAAIIKRMDFAESQLVRAKGGAGPNDRLDHTIPLELGGDNSDGNLKIVTKEEWEKYTPVENFLGELLIEGDIKEKEARELILEFKNGEITEKEIRAMF